MWPWLCCVLLVATAASSAPRKARVEQLERLRAWIESNEGGFVSAKADVRNVAGKGETMVVRERVQANERLAESRPLTPARVLDMWPDWKSLALDELTLMGLMLAVERFQLAPDTWVNRALLRKTQWMGPYADALPSRCVAALTFDKRDLDWLASLIGAAPEPTPPSVRRVYMDHLVKTGFTRDLPVTLEQLTWGICTAMTRSWIGHVMFPFGDLLSHGLDAEVNARMVMGVAAANASHVVSVQIVAQRDIAAGDEVVLSYGHKPNWELLVRFGFVLPDNPLDTIHLPQIDKAMKLSPEKQRLIALLMARSTNKDHLVLTWKGFDSFHAAAMRVMVEPKVDSYFFTRVHGKPQEWYPSEENEMAMLQLCMEVARLWMFRTFGPEDFAPLTKKLRAQLQSLDEGSPRAPVVQFKLSLLRLCEMFVSSVIQSMKLLERK